MVDERLLLKIYRRLEPGVHPELELGRFLTDVAGFAHTPPLLGSIEHVAADGTPTALAAAFAFVANQGDGWHLDRSTISTGCWRSCAIRLKPTGRRPRRLHEFYLTVAAAARPAHRRAAHGTGHRRPSDPAFAREPVTAADLDGWLVGSRADGRMRALRRTRAARPSAPARPSRADIDAVLATTAADRSDAGRTARRYRRVCVRPGRTATIAWARSWSPRATS